MKDEDIEYICGTVAGLAGIPVRIFDGDKRTFFSSVAELTADPMNIYKEEIFSINKSVGYFITPQFSCYGVVRRGEKRIILGPASRVRATDAELRELAFLSDVPQAEVDGFLLGMKSIALMPPESVMQILCVISFLLNGKKTSLSEVAIYGQTQRSISEQMVSEEGLNGTVTDAVSHNTVALENTLMKIVEKGDTEKLSEWTKAAPPIKGGTVAFTELRQLKNMFIVSVTLASRAAIRGGLDTEEALLLSDRYIQRCEFSNNAEIILNLQYHMIADYTERVGKIKAVGESSKFVREVAAAVRRRICEPMSVEAVAKDLFISRTHLSSEFHRRTGQTLSSYILNAKTEEAKRLLRYTAKPLSSVSSYLGFSSQSHFSRTFKRFAAMTPGEYREKYAENTGAES